MTTYWTLITEDRYSGEYSGGRWLSFPGVFENPRESMAFGSDIESDEFWQSTYSAPVGRGGTPDEAYRDMLSRGQP